MSNSVLVTIINLAYIADNSLNKPNFTVKPMTIIKKNNKLRTFIAIWGYLGL